ncbi:MAG: MIP family channel protein [Candidatus Micrarchaeota archaeon]|nr:MIP family channel protein [Candidatus Micrarchaeota archaeon]
MVKLNNFGSYVAEFLGTFALVFIGAGAVLVNALTGGAVGLVGIALAHGLVLMAMIYALGHFSGGHYNPAVTISMLVSKSITVSKAVAYIISQLLGAAFAGFLLFIMFPVATSSQLYGFPTTLSFGFGVLVEAVLTFFLVLTIYGVAVDNKSPKGFHGLAIGLVLTFDILMGGTQTGAAMNPARAFGPALASGVWAPQLIYWIGPIIGAILAAVVYTYILMDKDAKVDKKK